MKAWLETAILTDGSEVYNVCAQERASDVIVVLEASDGNSATALLRMFIAGEIIGIDSYVE